MSSDDVGTRHVRMRREGPIRFSRILIARCTAFDRFSASVVRTLPVIFSTSREQRKHQSRQAPAVIRPPSVAAPKRPPLPRCPAAPLPRAVPSSVPSCVPSCVAGGPNVPNRGLTAPPAAGSSVPL